MSPEEQTEVTRSGTWFLYLIECLGGSIYTGITKDVEARYAAHAAGKGARYTRSHPPAKLLAMMEYADRSSASKAEYCVKQLTPTEKRHFINKLNACKSIINAGNGGI